MIMKSFTVTGSQVATLIGENPYEDNTSSKFINQFIVKNGYHSKFKQDFEYCEIKDTLNNIPPNDIKKILTN